MVKYINELNNAMLYEKGRNEIATILKRSVDYTVFHFDYEEKNARKNGYDDLINHKNSCEVCK